MLIELLRLRRTSESEKNLEILLLRPRLAIVERRQAQLIPLSRSEKRSLVGLAAKLKATTGCRIKQMRRLSGP